MNTGVGRRARRAAALAVVLACVGSAVASGAEAVATVYYVCNDVSCPSASDTNAGTSEADPWKTVERVNAQALSPGDTVLFRGGDTFKEHGLWPTSSGAANNPIVYGSYGAGDAIMMMEVWVPPDRSWITIENLTVDGSEQGGATSESIAGVAGGGEGYDSHISVLHNTLENVGIGVLAAAPKTAFASDKDWLIAGNTITNVGESGVYAEGEDFTIEDNVIEHTGLDGNKPNKAHGVYLRARNSSVLSNVISHFASSGVSVRYSNSRVEDNSISYGPIGVSWFQYDHLAGTSTWSNNVISHLEGTNGEEAAFYVSPSQYEQFETELSENNLLVTKESFIITGNVMSEAGDYMNLSATTGTYTVTGNTPCDVTHQPGFCFGAGGTPVVSTGATTGVSATRATLTGTLNAEQSETEYRFEYGTTVAYGASIPAPGASVAAGAGSEEVTETLTGLKEGRTYHYRLLATNGVGTSYGNDETFATPSRWVQSAPLSSSVAPGTSPSAFAMPGGGERVYFVGAADDAIHELAFTPGVGWSQSDAISSAVAPGTSPSAFVSAEGDPRVSFVAASDEAIHELSYDQGLGWSQSGALSAQVELSSSPSAIVNSEGDSSIYFVGASDDAIHELQESPGSGWSQSAALTSAVAPGRSPSAVALPGGGERTYYVGAADEAIHELSFLAGSGWVQSGALAPAVASGSSPSAIVNSEGEPRVYYVTSSGNGIRDIAVHQLSYRPGSGWSQSRALSSAVAPETSPSAFAWPGGGERVYFVGAADDAIHELQSKPGSAWSQSGPLASGVAVGSSPSALLDSYGEPRVYFVGSAGGEAEAGAIEELAES